MIGLRKTLKEIQDGLAALLEKTQGMEKEIDAIQSVVMGEAPKHAKSKPGRKPGRKATRKVTGKKAAKKQAPKTRGRKKGTQSEQVLSLIEKNPDGISTGDIIKQTGLEKRAVYGVLNRAKKDGKVKSPKRGVFVMS